MINHDVARMGIDSVCCYGCHDDRRCQVVANRIDGRRCGIRVGWPLIGRRPGRWAGPRPRQRRRCLQSPVGLVAAPVASQSPSRSDVFQQRATVCVCVCARVSFHGPTTVRWCPSVSPVRVAVERKEINKSHRRPSKNRRVCLCAPVFVHDDWENKRISVCWRPCADF